MTDVILRISGMDCGACVVRIVRALQGLPGVHAVSVSDTAGCASLRTPQCFRLNPLCL